MWLRPDLVDIDLLTSPEICISCMSLYRHLEEKRLEDTLKSNRASFFSYQNNCGGCHHHEDAPKRL